MEYRICSCAIKSVIKKKNTTMIMIWWRKVLQCFFLFFLMIFTFAVCATAPNTSQKCNILVLNRRFQIGLIQGMWPGAMWVAIVSSPTCQILEGNTLSRNIAENIPDTFKILVTRICTLEGRLGFLEDNEIEWKSKMPAMKSKLQVLHKKMNMERRGRCNNQCFVGCPAGCEAGYTITG